MSTHFHAVKLASERATLRAYGLKKLADAAPLTWGSRLRSGGAGALIGGTIGAAHGFLTGGDPKADGSGPTFEDRMRAAASGGLQNAGIGAALGAIGTSAGAYGLSRQGLKNMFSETRGRNLVGEMGQYGLFGAPVTAYRRYMADLARHDGSHLKAIKQQYRRAYLPDANTPMLLKGLQYAAQGVPLALSAYSAAKTDDPDERNRMLARTASGLIAAPLVGNLGLPGAYLQEQISNIAERAVAKKAVPPQAQYDPATRAQVALLGARMNQPVMNFGEADAS